MPRRFALALVALLLLWLGALLAGRRLRGPAPPPPPGRHPAHADSRPARVAVFRVAERRPAPSGGARRSRGSRRRGVPAVGGGGGDGRAAPARARETLSRRLVPARRVPVARGHRRRRPVAAAARRAEGARHARGTALVGGLARGGHRDPGPRRNAREEPARGHAHRAPR